MSMALIFSLMPAPRISLRPLLALCLLAGCSPPPAFQPEAGTFQDAEGEAIVINPLPVTRIVSTMQSATEWVIALGATELLVARTDFDRQAQLAALPSIGGGLDPSPEVVASLRPDVVLGWRNRSSSDLQRALRSFQIPVVSMETADTADLFRHLHSLGILVGQRIRADSLAAALRADLRQVQASACPAGAQKLGESVMVILSTEPPMTAGGGTWMQTILEASCLQNAFGDLDATWPVVALEAVIARQPDWLLTSTGIPGQRLEELRALAGWKELRAVREGRVLEVSSDLLSRAGPTIAEAARAIVKARQEWHPQ